MTLGELQRRDARIVAARTRAEADELHALIYRRDCHWRRLPDLIARARRKAADLETYARQTGFTFLEDLP